MISFLDILVATPTGLITIAMVDRVFLRKQSPAVQVLGSLTLGAAAIVAAVMATRLDHELADYFKFADLILSVALIWFVVYKILDIVFNALDMNETLSLCLAATLAAGAACTCGVYVAFILAWNYY